MTKMKAKKGTKLEDTIVSKLEKFTTKGRRHQWVLIEKSFFIITVYSPFFPFYLSKNLDTSSSRSWDGVISPPYGW